MTTSTEDLVETEVPVGSDIVEEPTEVVMAEEAGSDVENADSDTSSVYVDSDNEEFIKPRTGDTPPSSETPTDGEPQILHKHKVSMKRLAKKKKVFLGLKLTRQIKTLKNKKGTEQQLAKNLRKSERFTTRLSEMKSLDLETIISDLIESKFSPPLNIETTPEWFTSELLADKLSFMKFVNSLSNPDARPSEVQKILKKSAPKKENSKDKLLSSTFTSLKPQSLKEREEPARKSNNPRGGDELFVGSLYNEGDDEVLRNILTVKKNRFVQTYKRFSVLFFPQVLYFSFD